MDWSLLSTVDPSSSLPSFAEMSMLDTLDKEMHRSLSHLLISAGIDNRLTDPLLIGAQMASLEGGASIVEKLCGYTRATSNNDMELSLDQRRLSCISTILPYILSTLKSLFDALAVQLTSSSISLFIRVCQRAINRISPILRSAWKILVITQQAAYLFGFSPYWNPILAVAQLSIIRQSGEASSTRNMSGGSSRVITRLIYSGALLGTIILIRTIDQLLRTAPRRTVISSSIPFPHAALPPRRTPTPSHLCPICLRVRQAPCVTTGGIVYCHDCISSALLERQVCPVSGVPCQQTNLIRVFDTE